MDKEFKSQIGRNLEVYMKDLVIKSKKEIAVLKDVEETFKTLRSIIMKLNPRKCSFGMEEGKFLGVIVTNGGFKANPEKLEAVLKMPSPKSVKQPELSGRLENWAIELGEHAIEYKPRPAIKGQVLADFIAEIPQGKEEECRKEIEPSVDQQKDKVWKLFTDGASNDEGAGAGLRITNPEGQHFTYTIRLEFKSTNNEAEYEALLAGLRIAKKLGAQHLEAHMDSMLVANQIEGSYDAKDEKMVSYSTHAKVLMAAFATCKVKHIKRSENKQEDALSKLASVGFEHLAKGVHIEVLATLSTMNREVYVCSAAETNWMTPIVTYLARAIDYFTKWVEAKPMATVNAASVKKFIWEFIICLFGLPMNLVNDNGTQFADQHIQRWLKELNITQTFTSVSHPQGNGEVERANRTIVGGIKKRLANHKSGWVDQLPHVLWAIQTRRNTSNAETPFSLTYDTEAMIPPKLASHHQGSHYKMTMRRKGVRPN
ncbi:uncharacterized protein LOC143568588 [Bidens hawaiensis]|uniref:uncharacterized protein LOC143568588 n=1 Tax=Bidens hawaiensis TaxID=980011 RepID=UPI0040491E53